MTSGPDRSEADSAVTPTAAAGALDTAAWHAAVAAIDDADDAAVLTEAGRLLDDMERGLSSL